ncbi:hypothetical protein [Acaryochloris sp. IP29b_bin.148]|uniref:hypothetical protein n=1 Tax=Acaryochloris sp. IP29b_bin.148 TaxID=2969218 RepID=UPI002624B7B9|nr:hypothetical protein [Acaryochloris sp. IP29b_bin.148]
MVNQDFMGDEQLRQLALNVQNAPPQSAERQRNLNYLVNNILHSGKLGHPHTGKYPQGIYQDLYNEALQKTLLKICTKIDQYNPVHPVMAWVNFVLSKTFIDVEKDVQRRGITYLPQALKNDMTILSLDDLNSPVSDLHPSTEVEKLRQFLKEDPEGRLQEEHLQNHTDITFQKIALAKYVDDLTWDSLSEQFKIPLPTLHSFFNRRLQKLMPYFHKYL